MDLTSIYTQIVDAESEHLEKVAEEDAAGRIMARGFMDELTKLAEGAGAMDSASMVHRRWGLRKDVPGRDREGNRIPSTPAADNSPSFIQKAQQQAKAAKKSGESAWWQWQKEKNRPRIERVNAAFNRRYQAEQAKRPPKVEAPVTANIRSPSPTAPPAPPPVSQGVARIAPISIPGSSVSAPSSLPRPQQRIADAKQSLPGPQR